MSTIDHINELRAELQACIFTRQERAALEAELASFIAERGAAGKADAEAETLPKILPSPEMRG